MGLAALPAVARQLRIELIRTHYKSCSPSHRQQNNMSSLLVRVWRLFSREKQQRAKAAALVIRFLCSQPFLAGTNWGRLPGKLPAEVLHQDHPLSQDILAMLKGQKDIDLETLLFFERMLDPKEGVQLPSYYLSQKRIKDGSLATESLGSLENSQSTQVFKYPFFPSRVVTPLVFKILTRFNDKTLLCGDAGIAKTSNIIFYSYLAGLITEYDFSSESKESSYKGIPRIIYLSYDSALKNNEDDILLLLKEQLPAQSDASKIQTFGVHARKLFRQKGLRGRVVLDQFNSIAAVLRDFNKMALYQKNTKIVQTQREKAKKTLSTWFQTARSLFNGAVLYNSSINIQEELLDYPGNNNNELAFDLNHHSPVDKFQISLQLDCLSDGKVPIPPNRQRQINRERVFNAFFEVLKRQQIEGGKLKQARQLCWEHQGSQRFLTWLTPLSTRTCFQEFDLFNEGADAQKIAALVLSKIQQYQGTIVKKKQMQAAKYLTNLNNSTALWLTCKYRAHLLNPPEQIEQWMEVDARHEKAVQKLDKSLFIYKVVKTDYGRRFKVRSTLPAYHFLKATSTVENLLIGRLSDDKFIDQLVQISRGHNAFIGHIVQSLVLQLIKSSQTFHFNQKFGIPAVFSKDSFNFVHFNTMQLSFQEQFQELIAKQQGTFVGFPVNKDFMSTSVNSKTIDLLVVIKTTQLRFFSIDFKTTSSKNQVDKCQEKAKILMDRHNIDWTHYIISMSKKEGEVSWKTKEQEQSSAYKKEYKKKIRYESLRDLNLHINGKWCQLVEKLLSAVR